MALALSAAPDGTVFVTVGGEVQHVDGSGTLLDAWGVRSGVTRADGFMQIAYGLAVAGDGTVYVGDSTGRIQRFGCP